MLNLVLVYDGECPFCRHYTSLVRVRQNVASLRLVNARDGGSLIDRIAENGYDLDEGMLLIADDRYYFGALAMQQLALLSTQKGLFNRLNAWLFKGVRRTRLLYPWLKCVRNITLSLLGRSRLSDR